MGSTAEVGKMSKFLPSWFGNINKVIKHNNGYMGTFLNIFRRDDGGFKFGDCVGEDKFGNRYFQNDYYFIGRSRWVEFSPQFGHDYDATHVPPEWHRWLQYISDETPSVAKLPHRKGCQNLMKTTVVQAKNMCLI